MNKDSTGNGSEPPVGYGNPPKHTRFQKGQSGNPKGRPPKSHLPSLFKQLDPLNALVLEQANRKLTVRTAHGDITLSQIEAALDRLYKMAMGGDFRSLVTYLELAKSAQDAQKELTQEVFRAVLLHQTYTEPFETAEREGKPVPKVLPHPKDVIIDLSNDDYPVQIVGPSTWTEQAKVEEWKQERDQADWTLKQLRMQDDIDQEELDFLIPRIEENRAKWNHALPPRLRKPPP